MEGNPFRISRADDAETTGKSGPISELEDISQNNEVLEAPIGWKTMAAIRSIVKVSGSKIESLIAKHEEGHEKEIREYRDSIGNVRRHYSPAFIEIIKADYEKVSERPFGWKTNREISQELSISKQKISAIADAHRQNGAYFSEYRKTTGAVFEHYSPELVKIIEDEISNTASRAPEGWETNNRLASQLGVDPSTIATIADEYRTHPKYFNQYKHKAGSLSEHFSPELVQIIIERVGTFKQTLKPPLGWMQKTEIFKKIKISPQRVDRVAEKYRSSHPAYFHYYKNEAGRVGEFYSPELVDLIEEKIAKEGKHILPPNSLEAEEYAPEDWKTASKLAKELGVDKSTISNYAEKHRDNNPEYFGVYKSRNRKAFEYYAPELSKLIQKDVNEVKNLPEAPEGWETASPLSARLGIGRLTAIEVAERYRISYPQYFKKFKTRNTIHEYYSPELVDIIEKETKLEEPPLGWETNSALASNLGIGFSSVSKLADKYRTNNPEYFKQYQSPRGPIYEYYSPELIKKITEEASIKKEAPDGWETTNSLKEKLEVDFATVSKIAEEYRVAYPEYFGEYKSPRGPIYEYYSPELISIIELRINKYEKAPEGWETNRTLSNKLKVDKSITVRIADNLRVNYPNDFVFFRERKIGRLFEHYSPELVEIIKNELVPLLEQREAKDQEGKLKNEFENLVENIVDPETADETARKIAEIIRLLPGNAHDIIIKYHPRYKGLRPDYVKQVIADYLGDFMLPKNEWQPGDIQKLKEVMDIEGIQEEILLNLKNGCLTFVNSERKNNPEMDELAIVEAYFEKEQMVELAGSGIKEVENALNELREYYDAIFRLRDKKPGNITNTLREGRTFPDINQLVNIQEIMDKKKMLIADEMGLGKSASAILTKEYLGLSCALVIMPSNVEDTWKNYLSDGVNEQGKQIGYFKQGLAPKILVIESPADTERLRSETFDYILISQEKAGGEQYGKALEQVNFDMMIVDEVHKLKNIESGVRSQAVEALANKISGENKYLALLSGTPVPNKVKDIAITLKLLYPEKYKDFDSKEMVKRILYGDLIDLRSELLKRMQMKELATSIEMPKLMEEDVIVELAPEEREIYEILLEEDELTALDKIMIFRQFLMNPEILKVEPGFVGSKIQKLGETLRQDFETQDKIVVFVNGYVEGVIKGEHNIIQKLNLPEDVIIEEIHGDISQAERARIQNELKSSDQKTVVFVSGQTADVGVDFSGADEMIEYNDPWSKYEKKQQQGRVYREGLKHDLVVKTLVTRDSIEEGIRAYINAKEKAIEKLLKGIGNTEAEKKLLYNDSKLVNNDIETNAQLSKEYLSDWEKLMLHFGEGYESGEKRFRQELAKTGKEYADLYKKLGRLTYQGNNARVSATLIERMAQERGESTNDLRVLDIASGPEMLKEASSGEIRDRIFSTDINIEHFATSSEPEKTMSASYLNLPARDGSIDYANLGFAFHQTSPIKYYKKNYERLQVLAEMNRALKVGGRAVISMLHNVQFTNMEKFEELVGQLGFQLVPEYTGEAKGKESYKAGIFTLEKVEDIPEYKSDALKFDSADNAKYITALGDKLGREFLQGLEMSKTLKGKSRLRDQRRMIDRVTLGGKEIEIILNDKDRALLDEEVRSIRDGEDLRTQYGGIQNIPIAEIKRIGFERKLETPGYYLLYKIIKDGGAVIIRGDYKPKAKKEVKEP